MNKEQDFLRSKGWDLWKDAVVLDQSEGEYSVYPSKDDLPITIQDMWLKDGELALTEDEAMEQEYDNWCDEHLSDNQDISYEDWEKNMLSEVLKNGHEHISISRSHNEWTFKCDGRTIIVRTDRLENIMYCPICNANIKLGVRF